MKEVREELEVWSALQEWREKEEDQVEMEREASVDPLVPKENLGYKASLDLLALRETEDTREILVRREMKVLGV